MYRVGILACRSTASTRFLSVAANTTPQTTYLHDLHQKYNGKFEPVEGFDLPLHYADQSARDSVLHTRQHASLFDVSHFSQTEIRGKDRIAFVESLTTADLEGLAVDSATFTVFTNEKGGIKGDVTVSKSEDALCLVTDDCFSASQPDLQALAASWRSQGKDVRIERLQGRGLIALQGPEAAKILSQETDLSSLFHMRTSVASLFGVDGCRITRNGFTGEDGVEISVAPEHAQKLAERILESKEGVARLAGTEAREILRVEAGLWQYGSDLDENTTPVEAGMEFVIAERRRQAGDFPGAKKILSQLNEQTNPKRRVGLLFGKGQAPRCHLPLIDPLDKAAIGFVTNGFESPTLGQKIALAYVDRPYASIDTGFLVDFGEEQSKVKVIEVPFVKPKFYTSR